uniref:Guanylate cyclase domain-containing protein n=1 Tax=Tetradesmus obliquus TaxID=3088 RepID=A0A383VLE1_TETOB
MRLVWHIWVVYLVLLVPEYASTAAVRCPGVTSGVCEEQCQLHVCKQLAAFYKATNNINPVNGPWDEEAGWEQTSQKNCSQLLAAARSSSSSSTAPAYCSWFGVTCCSAAESAAGRCSPVNAVAGVDLPLNNLNASISDDSFMAPLLQLHGCGLTVANLEQNCFDGSMTDAWGKMVNLRHISLANTWITGTIPDSLRNLRNLTKINLSNTFLSGTLPPWLPELTQLATVMLGQTTGLGGAFPRGMGQLDRLRELNLEGSALTGTLPDDLCHHQGTSKLLSFNIRRSGLSGNVSVLEQCHNLVQLDISHNNFTGQLPASQYWNQLTMYHANNNRFSGTLPRKLCRYVPLLRDLDISNNQVGGIIPSRIGLMLSLETINLANNQFTGPLTEYLFYFPGLRQLDLSNNQLVGTIPAYALMFTVALLSGDLSNNSGITGIIPPQMGFAGDLRRMSLKGTSLSCADVIKPYAVRVNNSCTNPNVCLTDVWAESSHGDDYVCPDEQVLPCFLAFSNESLPRDDASNMRCRLIVRRAPEDARAACSGSDPPFFLGGESESLPDNSESGSEQAWVIDPKYYQYRGCSCLLGFKEVWTNAGTKLTCTEQPSTDNRSTAIIAAVSAVAGFAILSALVAVGVLYLRTQPRWLRERVMQAKRVQGAPRAAKPGDRVAVSIVVTDVKGFSALTRQYPDAMIKAMGGHNNIMRKACHMHAGYVLDQEGDSWAVAFHDADDAVAFSLQVQQALARKVWLLKRPADAQSATQDSDLLLSLDSLRQQGLLQQGSYNRQLSLTSTTATEQTAGGSFPNAEAAAAVAAAAAAPAAAAAASIAPGDLEAAAGPAADAAFHHQQQQQHSNASLDRLIVMPSGDSQTAMASGPLRLSFTSSCGKAANAASSQSGSMAVRSEPGPATGASGPLAWLFKRPLSRTSSCSSSGQVHAGQLSVSSDTHPDLAGGSAAAAAAAGQLQQGELQQLQLSDAEAGRLDAADSSKLPALSGRQQSQASFGSAISYILGDGSRADGSSVHRSATSSGNRHQSRSSSLLQRLTHRSSRNGSLAGPLGSNTAQQQKQQLKALRISVRIGIASGTLLYGSDLQNCDVPQRAKELVSDVANGGQVLIDEPTFLLVKDSLSLLGTVSEAGYDDRLLQRLNQARVVGRLQQQVACATACSRREASFSSPLPEDEPQDYEHDAIVVHMGRFAAETPLAPGQPQAAASSKEDDTKATGDQQQQQQQQGWKGLEKLGRSLKGRSSKADGAGGEDGAAAAAAAAAAPAAPAAAAARGKSEPNMELLFVGNSKDQRIQSGKKGAAASKASLQVQQLHLYSIASPGMRRWPEHTQDLGAALAWAEPVNMKRGWAQLQKGFFQAPGARKMDLSPSAQQSTNHQAPLPDVTIVFASVADSLSFTAKQSRATVRGVHAAIVRVLLAQMEAVAGGDGYLCRCQEGAFQYMVAFEQPHHAVQWCLLVQEALLYEPWEPAVLRHPGFEPVTCPDSGRPLFAGPRLRMGLAEGPPHSVLPDHSGRANYAGPSVIRAARFMDAAAHGGQVVTNLELLRKLAIGWVAEQSEQQQQQQQQQQQLRTAVSLGPEPAGGFTWQQEQQQQQSPHVALTMRGGIPSIIEGQQLHIALQQQLRRHSEDSSSDCGGWRGSDQAVAPRSLSCSSAARGPAAAVYRPWKMNGLNDKAADVLGNQLAAAAEGMAAGSAAASSLDAVLALHLGQFRFKGSGEYDMVSLLHGALAGRTYPAEPPRGKGERLPGGVSPVVAVRDLPAVALRPPPELLAAREGLQQQQQQQQQQQYAQEEV